MGEQKTATTRNPLIRAPSILLGLLLLNLSACVTVPAAAVESSQLVGERIFELQTSHEAFVEAYFDTSRERIEDFLVYRWIPQFLDNFISEEILEPIINPMPFSQEEIERLRQELAQAQALSGQDIDTVVVALNRAFGDADRGEKILLVAEVANQAIERQRAELLAPVDRLERQALAELRATYADAIALQRAVTGYLQSISDVTTERDRILDQLELLESRDSVLDTVIAANDEIETVLTSDRSAEEVLCSLRKLLGIDIGDEAGCGEGALIDRLFDDIQGSEPADPEDR